MTSEPVVGRCQAPTKKGNSFPVARHRSSSRASHLTLARLPNKPLMLSQCCYSAPAILRHSLSASSSSLPVNHYRVRRHGATKEEEDRYCESLLLQRKEPS